MPRTPPALLAARLENERLRLELANKRLGLVVNKFDVLQSQAQKKRRQPTVERESEDKLLRLYDRLRSVNLARDLERNFTAAKSALNQFRINVVGTGPKLQLHTADGAWNDAAADWFNADYAKACDFRQDMHLADQLKSALAALKREGDVLAAIDDGWIEDTGQLLWWESDQLVNVDDLSSAGGRWSEFKQEQGVLFDSWGRVVAYAVTGQHGQHSVKFVYATILPRTVSRMLRRTWRFNQLRGTADMLTVAADLQDLYEMRSKEMQSAKVAAGMAGVVKKSTGSEEFLAKRADATGDGTLPEGDAQVAYERLESLTGGFLEYLEPEDTFELLDHNRPNVNFLGAFDFILRSAGSALGLSKTYTTLNTEASYTAFRGDLLLSWAQFRCDQKDLERQACDWIGTRAIGWAVRKGLLPAGPANWQRTLAWEWPKQPDVDPLKEATAAAVRLGNLLSTYSDEVGPEWAKKFKQASEELKTAQGLGLPSKVFDAITAPQPAEMVPPGDRGA